MQINLRSSRTSAPLRRLTIFTALCALLITNGDTLAASIKMRVIVDATELPRNILNSTITFPLVNKTRSFVYPKWIPGSHAPRGPVQNIGGLSVTSRDGKTIEWKRDWSDVYRFFASGSSREISVSLDYICSQSSTNSRGVDSYGFSNLGAINWNTVVVYPEGVDVSDILVTVSLILPPKWKHGSALKVSRQSGDTVHFQETTFEEFMDSPLICGENFRTISLGKTDNASYWLHIAADDAGDIPQEDSILAPFVKLTLEAEALFGGTHFSDYHFLLILSDGIPRLGLEHRSSSLNSGKADELRDLDWKDKRIPYLLPHEMSHAWCGKYRRPVGMYTRNYMEPKNTELLWVYEGFDQYAGYLLSIRSGFEEPEDFIEKIAANIGGLIHQKGRNWRPLRDTEVSSYTLRGGSRHWGNMRRGQDYYREGATLWMEIDARLRNMTNGEKSIEDFCHEFFTRGGGKEHAVPFDLKEIVETLNRQAPFNWDSLITLRVEKTQEVFDPEVAPQCGYRLAYTTETPERIKDYKKRFKSIFLYESLGMSVNAKGKVGQVIPGSPADLAGIYDGMEIVGIQGKKYSMKRLEDATRNSVMNGSVDLLTLDGDNFREISILFGDGLRFYTLERDESKPDRITEIITPLTK